MSNINIQENITLAPYTTFKIGGPAKFFVEAKNEEELLEALQYAKNNNLEVFILGGGSNVLISDSGFDGLVIRLRNTKYQIQNTIIECGAGMAISEVVKLAAGNSLTGLEWAAGIPGSVGGAVRGNAGAYGNSMSDIIESVKVVELKSKTPNINPKIKILNNSDCHFSYRHSHFKENTDLIIISVVLKLQKGNKSEIENKMKEIIKKRSEKIPKEFSPGSYFKNPTVKDKKLIARFEKDTGLKCENERIPAAWLIAEAGLSGKRMGKAQLSEKHANFVVNLGGAKAQEVVMLASFIKQKIRTEFGVQLKEEVQYLGL